MKTIFSLLSLFYLLVSFADVEIDPNDFIHLNRGCPENSLCSNEIGKLSSKFKKAFESNFKLQDQFFKKYGLPLSAYSHVTPKATDTLGVSFNSECPEHRKVDLFYTTQFLKNTDSKALKVHDNKSFLKPKVEFSFKPIYIKVKNDLKEIFVGIKDYPSFIDGDKLALMGDFDDLLFQYSVDINQNVKLINSPFFTNDKVIYTKKVVVCPEDFSKIKIPQFFTERFCKKIYNIKTKKEEIILDFKACN